MKSVTIINKDKFLNSISDDESVYADKRDFNPQARTRKLNAFWQRIMLSLNNEECTGWVLNNIKVLKNELLGSKKGSSLLHHACRVIEVLLNTMLDTAQISLKHASHVLQQVDSDN